ncbi:MAG: PhoU domain-containing protein [Gemmatimonadales bacterium]|nr:MAG: PhoU domain-containing protein [Gemmatimonadales bacterium]
MLRELLAAFRSKHPLAEMGANFARMVGLTGESIQEAGQLFFGDSAIDPAAVAQVRQRDVEINALQRTIRRQVVAHLSFETTRGDVPYCLLVISLVKDVERLGDYAKNLSEVRAIHPDPLPDDAIVRELLAARDWITADYHVLSDVLQQTDRVSADRLISEGRVISRQLDALIGKIAAAGYDGRTAAAIVMGTRFYKRIVGHIINVLTGVVQPLDKLDYYDEDDAREM